MPTVLTHAAIPLAMAIGLGSKRVSRRLMTAGIIASMLPDLDVIAFHFGIPYAAAFGHRGFSHSLLFAFIVALAGACLFGWLRSTFLRSFLFLLVATASHGILDAFTTGGLGIAFLWPWSADRFFAPAQVIEVAPFGLSRLLSPRGAAVLWSEFLWVWAPLTAMAVSAALSRRLTLAVRARRGKPQN
jgi:inner membrane protein